MYTITHNGRPLFDPRTTYLLEAPTMQLEANKLSSLSFTIYPNHPEYGLIEPYTSQFSVYEDGTLLYRLRAVSPRKTFTGGMTWQCEELAAQLDDVFRRPNYYNGTISGYITAVLAEYNGRVSNDRAVLVGNLTHLPSEGIIAINDGYDGFWQSLQSQVAEEYGGYILPRYTESAVYIDYLGDADLPLSSQSIRFGENMAEMFIDTDGSEAFSVLIPLGPNQTINNVQPGQSSQRPMTIASVNGGLDYLENATAIALYGRREKTQQWQSATSPSDLKTKGQAYLAEHATPLKKSISLSAVDLRNVNVNVAALRWMTRVPIYSEPHNVDVTYTLEKVTLPLGEPDLLKVEMGEPREVFTDRVPPSSVSHRSSGGRGSRAASQRQNEYWEMIVQGQDEELAALGLTQLYTTGIILKPGTARIFSVTDGLVSQQADISVQSDRIGLVVTDDTTPAIKTASIVAAINDAGSSIHINADKIYLNGETIANAISATNAKITNLTTGNSVAEKLFATYVYAQQDFRVGNTYAYWSSVSMPNVLDGAYNKVLGTQDMNLAHYHDITATEGTGSDAGKILITLGATRATEGTTNFNIAATQFYQDGVAAAAAGVTVGNPSWTNNDGNTSTHFSVTASNGNSKTQYVYLTRSSWSSGSCVVRLRPGTATSSSVASNTVTIPDPGSSDWSISPRIATQTVTVTIGGKTFSHTFS